LSKVRLLSGIEMVYLFLDLGVCDCVVGERIGLVWDARSWGRFCFCNCCSGVWAWCCCCCWWCWCWCWNLSKAVVEGAPMEVWFVGAGTRWWWWPCCICCCPMNPATSEKVELGLMPIALVIVLEMVEVVVVGLKFISDWWSSWDSLVGGCTRLGKENEPFSWPESKQEVVFGDIEAAVEVTVGGFWVVVVAVKVAALQLLTMAKRSQSSWVIFWRKGCGGYA